MYIYIYVFICFDFLVTPPRFTKFNAINDLEFGRSLEAESALNCFGIVFDSGNLP